MSDGWSLPDVTIDWIIKNIPKNSRILEFGSGMGSVELAGHFEMYSIEHDEEWLNKSKQVNYIHAPLQETEDGMEWYDSEIVTNILKEPFDAIIIDGPPASIGRKEICNYLEFMREVPIIIVDDTQRDEEHEIAVVIQEEFARTAKTLHESGQWSRVTTILFSTQRHAEEIVHSSSEVIQ